jgi:leucyl-tRNA---protein transferase
LQDPFLYSHCQKVSPEDMDSFWADAWRNFGTYFFRNQFDYLETQEQWVQIVPLRINLAKFSFRKHQLKLLRRQANTIVKYQPIELDERRKKMFEKHIQRFTHNRPTALSDFLGENPSIEPCDALECALYDENEQLYAASYFGIGKHSISSIYATFDTDYQERSPGLHTLLAEIQYAQNEGKSFVYLGYAHNVPSHYDYKKTSMAWNIMTGMANG